MKYNTTVFPVQKLKSSQKNEIWRQQCVDYVVGMAETVPSGQNRTQFEEMQTLYDLYNSVFNEKDIKYVTDPFKQEDGFPASPQNMNIIKPKIDLLLGEETKQPFGFRVIRTSNEATSEVQDKMKSMLYDYSMAKLMSTMTEQGAQEFQSKLANGEIMPPEGIAKYMSQSYKDIAESTAYHTLSYLKEKLNLPHQFHRGWKDALIGGREVYYVGILNGEPAVERVNPMYFSHDTSPDIQFIEDSDWACRRLRMSYTEIYDRLSDKMDDKQLDKLLAMTGQDPITGRYGVDSPGGMLDYNHWDFRNLSTMAGDNMLNRNQLNLWHATWRSYKKVGFLKYIDEDGQLQETTVSEDYMKTGMEIDLKWDWIIEVWEGYRIGQDLYVGIQPLEYQHVSTSSPNSQKLPYSGVIYNNTNSRPKSLAAIMKPLQYMYIIIWYRLELALARDKGKVITMDITQIPKSMNIDAAKWMHYLSSVGVNFVNPYEEGWDVPGREGGKASQFNQITALDLTMANVIDQYINLMAKIEDMVGEISGVSRQREGQISTSEVGVNVQRATTQSNHITEPLFWMHNQCKRNVLTMLLNTAKHAWRDSGKTHLQYMLDDTNRTFLQLADEFFYEDFDIFISDSTKENQNIEMIKSLYQPAMQNGASLLDIAEIMTLDNIASIKSKLGEIEKKRAEQQQQMQDAESQREMQLEQVKNQSKQQELQLQQQKLELDKYKIDTDNQTKITLAEIDAYKFQQDLDANGDGIPDPMQIADLSIKRMELDANRMDMQMNAMQKQQEASDKNDLENRKISEQSKLEKEKIKLEKEKMAHETKLQAAKDNAAMAREITKGKFALRNKTTGEK